MFSVTPNEVRDLRKGVKAANLDKLYIALKAQTDEALLAAKARLQAGEDVRSVEVPIKGEDFESIEALKGRLLGDLHQAGFIAEWSLPDADLVRGTPLLVYVLISFR